MDKLYKFGLSKIFLAIALTACKKYGVAHKYSHLDSTSISFIFYGQRVEMATNKPSEQLLAVLSLHLLQVCLIYI